ncbi:MAG TPA: peptide ABC transporter substrate-binding protein [Opitutaceae bacterium]|nr:peptide ABC transporter substrate-binding protein [Opitutaceae bacterium]
MLVGLVSGCARRTPPQAQVVRISQRNEPADLDPATAALPDEFFIIRALGEGLLVPNPAGGPPLPGAAARYDVSSDGLRYTFHLRPDLRWSNGERVTASDFLTSWQRVLDPATAAPKADLFRSVKNAAEFNAGRIADFRKVGFEAPDDRTIVVSLTHAQPDFPFYAASGPWIPVNPRVVAKFGRHWTEPAHYVGNGPFTLVEWRHEQRVVVQRNPAYHGAARIRLDRIEFIRFDNQDTEERAFRAGQIEVTMAVPQTKLAVYGQEHPDELHRAALAETRFLAFNTTRPPLTDPRVRRALALAIDRSKIVRDVLRGGQLPAHRFLSPALRTVPAEGMRREASGAPRPEAAGDVGGLPHFDPVEARRLLAEAGYPNGAGFPRLEFAGWDRNPALEAIQQMWRAELGIEVRIVVQEARVHLAALTAGNYDIAFVTNLLDIPSARAALADFTTNAPNNFPHWHSGAFDRLLAAAATEPRAASAAVLRHRAETLLLSDAAIAPIYFNVQNWLMSPRVHGWEQDALWQRRYNDLTVGK